MVWAWVAVILLGLLAWFGLELITTAGQAGLAERVARRGAGGLAVPGGHVLPASVTVTARDRLLPECG